MVQRWCRLLGALGALASAACASPTLTGLSATSGRPRAVVSALGQNLGWSTVVWDAGRATERKLPTGIAQPIFTVPADAAPGLHPITIVTANGTRFSKEFTVENQPPLRIDRPRVDRITSTFTTFDNGAVNAWLYVQGANFDIGAVVLVDDAEVASAPHKAIANNLYDLPEDQLGYPIYHYASVLAALGPRPPGQSVDITVRNLDGSRSLARTFTVPSGPTALDSDGDSLPDGWEAAGHDADGDGVSDTDPARADIFVELDVMEGLQLAPTSTDALGTLDTVRAMFSNAPVLNPFAPSGINLVIDASGTVPRAEKVFFDLPGQPYSLNDNPVFFSTLKSAHFDHHALGDVYHYVVWARWLTNNRSGRSDRTLNSPIEPGDDIAIGLAGLGSAFDIPRSQAETLAHELGHNLGQRHGGLTDDLYNPNYWSVMSATWQLRTSQATSVLRERSTCLPLYYGVAGQTEGPDHEIPASVRMIVDYSSGMGPQVVENNNSLNEPTGVCGHPVDWDNDGSMLRTGVSTDANDNGPDQDTIDDFANWRALRFDGPKLNGLIP